MTATAPIITSMLNTADPIMVPSPISTWPPGLMTAKIAMASSGALEPAAINVAPAMLEDIFHFRAMTSREGIK